MLSRKLKYLQVALNSSIEQARMVISQLPASERILLEAGTPLIKAYGVGAIYNLRNWWSQKTYSLGINPYIVADLKTIDRGKTEVYLAADAGASGIIAMGQAPIETLDIFISVCKERGVDSMIDMMNIDQPVKVLRKLRRSPDVVVLHRGVDEEAYNKSKPIPYIQINKIRATYDVMVSIAGGDTVREVQRAVFNDADIVIVWKEFYNSGANAAYLASEFLKEIK